MLRIHFTEKDLSLLTFAPGADPMWEVVTSSFRLRRPEGRQIFGRWRDTTRGSLPSSTPALLEAIPPYGYFPDFLSPVNGSATLEEGLDALVHTPVDDIRTDLRELSGEHRVPRWLAGAAYGEDRGLRELTRTAREYYRACIEPHWTHISRTVARDRARSAEALLTGGPNHLLATLHPAVRWRPPVLEVRFPVEQDLYLDGRGLRLVPSFFCLGMPTTYKNPDLPPTLVYSVDHLSPLDAALPGRSVTVPSGEDGAVAALIGETRARVLRTIAAGDCNTTELARRTRTSPATASQHASILRNSGLIESYQSGRSTVHIATTLGRRLLLGKHLDE